MRRACLLFVAITLVLSPRAWSQGLVLIVNPKSGVQCLTRNQALDIFLGRYRKLPSGISAIPIDLQRDAPERTQFYLSIAHKDPADMSSYWARLVFSGESSPPFQASDAHSAVDLVATNPNAIAYVARSAADNRVRIVLELD